MFMRFVMAKAAKAKLPINFTSSPEIKPWLFISNVYLADLLGTIRQEHNSKSGSHPYAKTRRYCW